MLLTFLLVWNPLCRHFEAELLTQDFESMMYFLHHSLPERVDPDVIMDVSQESMSLTSPSHFPLAVLTPSPSHALTHLSSLCLVRSGARLTLRWPLTFLSASLASMAMLRNSSEAPY